MAIIKGGAFEGARKSVGNVTIRNVNGQTIMSSKVYQNKSNTSKQAARRSSFGLLSKLGRSLKPIISVGFDPVRHGSRFNNFTKSNTDLSNYFSQNKTEDTYPRPLHALYQALTDEAFIGQAVAAKGNLNSKSEFMVDQEGQINGLVSLSRDFIAGDSLTIASIALFWYNNTDFHMIELTTHTLGTADIAELANPRQLIINRMNWPELNINTLFPFPGDITGLMMAAIVSNNAERSTAAFVVGGLRVGG
jgi:hypothetical protein